MRNLLTGAFLFLSFSVFSQADSGMHFTHGLSWKKVKEKARAENKFIFVDAFTTWCGPCRVMAKTIFPLASVGNFYNENYINLKVQLDTTSRDNEEVKSWYADAHEIMKSYKVNVFPTYLFFSPGGKLVHRAVGSSEAEAFISKGKDALDSSKQYYTLAERYENGERDPAFLKDLAEASMAAYEKDATRKYSSAYLRTQSNVLTGDNLHFLDNVTLSTKDTGFGIILANTAAFNKVIGKGKAEDKIKRIVWNEEISPALFSSEAEPDWNKLEQGLHAKYSSVSTEIYAYSKVLYNYYKNNWQEFSKAVNAYLKNYENNVSANELNLYAWKIFQNCDDMGCISDALNWSKKSVDITNNPVYMDTYANLLFKSGKNKEAIQWEEKAIKRANESKENDETFSNNLEKMKKGEKTW
jgi:thiol-disulfide isomerase/thioredoxin